MKEKGKGKKERRHSVGEPDEENGGTIGTEEEKGENIKG